MSSHTVLVGGVSCTLFHKNPNWKIGDTTIKEAIPFVYCLHGRLGKQEDIASIAKETANLGFIAVTFDNPNHGLRKIDGAQNNSWVKGNQTHSVDMYAQILQTISEVSLMIDFLPHKIGVMCSSVGVLGISQGGHATLIALANEPRIDVCVSFISSGDYKLNMEVRYENLVERAKRKGLPLPDPFESLVPKQFLEKTVRRYDPIHNTKSLCKGFRPLLIVNGGEDKLVPIECNIKLMKEIEPLYESAGAIMNLKHVILEGVKHETPKQMVDLGLQWLKEHLGNKRSSGL
mmetsp:Transcript_7798/g.9384  ORF Transcript_7798/g.9384 Transcript_7798/m.9384 type:complete len:289 (-) Transcript_7798:798-1664(-)